jgi:hypothetical protein
LNREREGSGSLQERLYAATETIEGTFRRGEKPLAQEEKVDNSEG